MNATLDSSREHRIAWFGLIAALFVFGFGVWRSLFLIDDAFISFRYAEHWVAGHGLVYNIGNPAPVEGYSNFAWVALLAAGLRLGFEVTTVAHVLSILSGATTLVLVQRFLRRRLELDALRTSLSLLVLAALPSFHVWASGGLETAFFGLLLFATWTLLCVPSNITRISHGVLAGLCGGLLILTRAEGFLWVVGLCAASLVASGGLVAGGGLRARRWVPFIGLSLAVFSVQLAWRHSYYGDWLPNTVHAKASLGGATLARGARTLGSWGLSSVWPLLALCAPLVAPAGKTRRLAYSALVMIAGGLAYNLAVGGDWMPFFRFLAPLSSFLAVAFGLLLSRFAVGPATALGLASATLACLPAFDVQLAPRALREALYFRHFRIGYQSEWERWQTGSRNTQLYTWIGLSLAQSMQPGDSWTGGPIGAIGYYSGLRILDRNGLVHRGVARREVQTAGATAGHEKRVPRIWFRDQSPTFYDALILPKALPSSGKAFDQAVARIYQAFLTDPEEAGLLRCSFVEVRTVRDIPGLPSPSSLVLLRHTSERQKADAFWSRYGR